MSPQMEANANAKAAMAYNVAADHFDHPVSSFWHRFGLRTVERIGRRPGTEDYSYRFAGDSALAACTSAQRRDDHLELLLQGGSCTNCPCTGL